MKSYFTTGQFARLANVTERTIRYYDKQGLLKPSFIMENGYRKYSEDDFIRLQRIISLKQLGFSLNEIKMMDIDTLEVLSVSQNAMDEFPSDNVIHLPSWDKVAVASVQPIYTPLAMAGFLDECNADEEDDSDETDDNDDVE